MGRICFFARTKGGGVLFRRTKGRGVLFAGGMSGTDEEKEEGVLLTYARIAIEGGFY